MLNQESIEEFRQIYFQVFGLEIDTQTALELANRLVRLLKTVYYPNLH
jgi:hypothetical protein